MIAKCILTSDHLSLTEGKEYEVIFEYDTVYEVKLDNEKIGCIPKGLFEVLK